MRLSCPRFLRCADLYRYYGEANPRTFLRMLLSYWEAPGAKHAFLIRLIAYLHVATPRPVFWPCYVVARIFPKHDEDKWHTGSPPGVRVGPGLFIGHLGDTASDRHAILGANCTISQGVSIGQASRGTHEGTPSRGSNAFVGPGANTFGNIRIGDNAAIGAKGVVTPDIPHNAVVVRVPGRIISYNGSNGCTPHTDYPNPFAGDPAREDGIPGAARARSSRSRHRKGGCLGASPTANPRESATSAYEPTDISPRAPAPIAARRRHPVAITAIVFVVALEKR